jgi:Ca2+-binding RTX toxin-like protein
MPGPTERYRLRRLARVCLLAFAISLLPTTFANASATTSCSFDSGTATVTATIGSNDSPTLLRSGNAITFGGAACDAATVTNTDTINVSAPDPASSEGLTISIAGGQFAPGKTAEGDGSDEIEIALTLAADEPLTIIGSSDADDLTALGDVVDLKPGTASEYEVSRSAFDDTTPTTLIGGQGNDHLNMTTPFNSSDFSTNSTVLAGPGDDVITPSPYKGSLYDGGNGADSISYPNLWDGEGIMVHVTSASVSATVDRGNGVTTATDTLTDIEAIGGSPEDDTFYGSTGNDLFDGAGGDDWFLPWGGDDSIVGGTGFDELTVGASTAPVTFDMTAETTSGEGTDTFDGIEILQGSPNDDDFVGDPELAGVIVLDGSGGQDVLDLRGAESGQTVYTSTVAYAPSPVAAIGIQRIIGSPFRDKIIVYQTPADGGGVHFSGGGANDRLTGGPRRDLLEGDGGDDIIDGKGAVDTCRGGRGTDTLLHCEL